MKLLLPGMALAAVLATVAAVAPSLAQPAGPPPVDRGAPGMDRPGIDGPRMDPAERAKARAQHLRDVLQLTPAQEPALTGFLDAMKPPEGMRERMREQRGEMMRLTTPERLDRMRDRMQRRAAEFDRRAMAIKRFYAQLSPSQQKAFDAMGPLHGRMGGLRHGGHGHGGPGGMGMAPRPPG